MSGSAPFSEEWNQSSTTLTAKPRFLRLRIAGGGNCRRPAGAATCRARADLEAGVEALGKFDDGPVEVRDARFEAVGHRELVGVHQQFVGKRRADLE